MRAICAKVILKRLLVANIDENALEDAHVRIAIEWWQHTALHHILHRSHCLKTYRLSACVRAGNQKYSVLLIKGDVKRYHTLALSV